MKKFLLRHFYNISLGIGIVALIGAIIFWKDMSFLQGLAVLNFAVINFHFFEEFGFPGGFPKFCNTIFACNGLMSIFWTQKVKLFYAALLANNSH